jgi:1-acyl-sn-glycerol-3-phosphate acyltransferase
LRHGGSVLIDEKKIPNKPYQPLGLAEYMKYNRSAVIFPEGTRSKTVPKRSLKQD